MQAPAPVAQVLETMVQEWAQAFQLQVVQLSAFAASSSVSDYGLVMLGRERKPGLSELD